MNTKGKRAIKRAVQLALLIAVMLVGSNVQGAEILKIEPIKHDVGMIEEGKPAVMRAEVTNISGQEVTIGNVRTN
jgi:hypothetical protein